ncbi:MAG: PleD family two-component response regulator [Psychrobacter glaciei]|jgi:PleD family two-component response regulator
MHGQINLSSEFGKGTQINVKIKAKTLDALKGLSVEINSLVNSGEKIGFILQANNNEIRDFILANWQLPVLQHPFSPAQCTACISALCIDKSANNTTSSHQQHSENQVHALYEGHVLLVEDNDINQLVAGDMLEGLGLTFDVVDNGQKCLDAVISEKQYDIIFMDVQMPIMDGYTATRELRQRGYSQ